LHPLRQSVCLFAARKQKHLFTGLRGRLRQVADVAVTSAEGNCAERLSRFFPQAKPVRRPVQVSSLRPGNSRLRESTVVEFGGPLYAILLTTLPLEFDDRVKLQGDTPGRVAEAVVIAVQYHEGRKAVAVRFSDGPCDWITQP
jgi:hypothetical protein